MWTFLVSAVAPVVFRVLAALGMGWITFEAIGVALDNFQSVILSSWGLLPTGIYQLLSIARFPEALGMILGALAFRVAWASVPRLGKLSS